MNKNVRAWTDVYYRESLSADERASLASNPAGELELDELDLEMIAGGNTHKAPTGTCPMGTGGCSCGHCPPKAYSSGTGSSSGSGS